MSHFIPFLEVQFFCIFPFNRVLWKKSLVGAGISEQLLLKMQKHLASSILIGKHTMKHTRNVKIYVSQASWILKNISNNQEWISC